MTEEVEWKNEGRNKEVNNKGDGTFIKLKLVATSGGKKSVHV